MREKISEIFTGWGIGDPYNEWLSFISLILIIAVICLIINLITKKLILRILGRYIRGNRFKWDNTLLDRKVFSRFANIIPVVVVYLFAPVFPEQKEIIQKTAVMIIYVIMILVINALINSADDIYRTYDISRNRPIKGYLQVLKIIVFIVGIIVIIASMIGKSPLILLGGLGAASAILLVIFRDSLLGLVAGVLINSNDMLRIGDWIEMPKYGADGDVTDITLHTVKVENFDKTITTIPSYALISDSFRNWRGMTEAGGRRIKRSIYIDQTSIDFCSDELIEKFEKMHYLTEYIQKKKAEIEGYNQTHGIDSSQPVNGRRMTNIGTFRAYIQNYLKNHPKVHSGLIQMVRQLPPGEHGLPVEIYVFTNDTAWVNYESIQADIFDHILAVIPYFGLRVFQDPTGYDIRAGFGRRSNEKTQETNTC